MMEVEQYTSQRDASTVLAALLDEFSLVTDYRALRDNLPRRLTGLLKCRCVLLYQHMGETLHFSSGSFADQPGWSAALLAVAHINPIELTSDLPEAQAWRTRRAVTAPRSGVERALLCAPLIYRQRAIGVLTALHGTGDAQEDVHVQHSVSGWLPEEVPLIAVVANVVAMLLENTRLLERDRERIHELSLLNSITSQMNCSLRERRRVQQILIQRAREITSADLCEVLLPVTEADSCAWISFELRNRLFQRWQSDLHYVPLVLERAGDLHSDDYLAALSPRIKTFLAVPLISNSTRKAPSLAPDTKDQHTRVLGVIVGAYHRPWKLRREELALLQILANQAGAALENISLMEDVVEARNEARRLLRRVLVDQRVKELILESIPSGLITIDMQGRITTFNRAAEAVLGYHPLEVLGQPVHKILDLRDLEHVLQSGQPRHDTLLTSGRQGQEIALDVTLMPLRDDRSRQIGVLATFADVTTMHHLEEEKRRLDRLASLGEMSASVAHEVRNPLASIKTSMQMLLDDLDGDNGLSEADDIQDAISVVLKEVERLDSIVRDLLSFARPRQLHLVECDLAQLSERILRFLRPQCDERAVRVSLTTQQLPPVHVDVAQIEQVLMNLFLNALQSMSDGGVLSVSWQVVQMPVLETPGYACSPREGETSVYSGLLDDDPLDASPDEEKAVAERPWVELSVSDTGTGISSDDRERIFQPFYTTRAHGIGLGLPITRRLIEDHHGYILIESQLGYGTTVVVRLPLDRP